MIPSSEEVEAQVLQPARVLWDYLRLNQPLRRADIILAMGSHDLRVGEHAAKLLLEGWAPLLVCAGGLGRLTKDSWDEAEARKFAGIAEAAGVPKDRILVEDKSTNTAENLKFSRTLLANRGIKAKSAILVHKPYMERRALATADIIWPEINCTVSSPPLTFEDYPTEEIPLAEVIAIMVGDFQRIILYAERGFQSQQDVPPEAMEAFLQLIAYGYDWHLIK